MKNFLLLSVVLLAACSKQELPKSEPNGNSNIVSYVNKHYAENDPAARLDFIQLSEIAIKSSPELQAGYNADATEVKLLPKNISNSQFEKFKNWESIKIIRNADSENWKSFLVEVLDKQGYENSKKASFNTCKDVWKNIDNRVPAVIDELATKIEDYEKLNSTAATTQVRYGYLFNLDASHFQDGYPVVCMIAYDKN
ncbi:hypothetical protein Q7567_08040 [Acinetobacter baumannii]|uniref:hypothetical protein n=1 Tax=Acinetobacter calcoaceticus/baumannii complex TaxID=909768 RepID=UPI00229C8B63|nr:hypothetical protein [Acinetobacter baumannii]HCW5857636.1 hypothetical protein [Acinetobacter baumannii]HCW5872917.1 hypothetical protein [Acinetobacter baumannii]HCW5877105.1 hypothetical protein [Acinetobacter baumannii]HCW5881022.1 hypothetical protein [Acinetobacter baumannii]